MELQELSQREQEILEAIVQHFVLTGSPVGSRTISKRSDNELSAASIRNVMADLEEKGYLDHPHTSAGRIPTTRGYRLYVDHLVNLVHLTGAEKELIRENIGQFGGDVDFILQKTIQIIARISNQLGVLLTPQFDEGILEKLDVVKVASDKILVVLSITGGFARTIMLEVRREFSPFVLEKIIALLNERLSGLKIREIKFSFGDRVKDLLYEETGLVRLFVESAESLFNYTTYSDVRYSGTSNILHNPEFSDIQKFSALIEFFEEKNIIVHMMEKLTDSPGVKIIIGDENTEKPIRECSIITAPYSLGNVDGLLGVIGPMRMAYRRIIPIVDFTAKVITELFQKK